MQTYKDIIQEFFVNGTLRENIESVNYAIFHIGASRDDSFDNDESREHLFRLWQLISFLKDIEKIQLNGNI